MKLNIKPLIILFIGFVFGLIRCTNENSFLTTNTAHLKSQNWFYLIIQTVMPLIICLIYLMAQIRKSRTMIAVVIGSSVVMVILILGFGIAYIDGPGAMMNVDIAKLQAVTNGYKIAHVLSPFTGKLVTFRAMLSGAFNFNTVSALVHPVLYIASLVSVALTGGIDLLKK